MNELHYQVDLLKAINQRLSQREKVYKLICDSSPCAYLYYSFEKNDVITVGKWNEYFSFEAKEAKDIIRIVDEVEEKYALVLRDLLFLEKRGADTDFIECRRKDGRVWYEVRTVITYGEDREPLEKLVIVADITKTRNQREELIYMAHYDSITGLYNRNYFVSLLSGYVRMAEEKNDIISVMVIDIDDFKKVNDGLGMVVGDELIQVFGGFLKEFMETNTIVCHLNNDVYCIAIYGPSGSNSVETIQKKIRRRTKEPFVLSNGQNVNITVSIGVAEYPEAAVTALELINCAEIVMFRCKANGKNSIQYFDSLILNDFLNDIDMENKLKEAVFNSNFMLYYQPQFFTGNKQLRGMEALIRWRDENGHMINPAVFIPIAEKNGCIVPIGSWVVEQSIRQYAQWRKQYGIPFIMSINISPVQYHKDGFVESLLSVLEKYDVAPHDIEIEITESVLIEDFAKVSEKLRILRENGIRVSLDDFGTGYSSLSYLMKLPIDTLKIDKSFIDTVLTDGTTRIITESIINMMKSLGFESIAEGVEQEAQYRYLHSIGCDAIQGYLLSKPKSTEEIEELLQGIL